jgi:GNAT superfamily N-acetyltransferase
MSDYRITVEEQANEQDRQRVDQGLDAYNTAHVGQHGYRPLGIFLRDREGAVVAGLLGGSYWEWLYVSTLWVHEDLRGQGWGSQLLRAAEQEALRRGCRGVHLDTMSFQALPFYQGHGYVVFGTLDDMPPGHQRFFLKKTLQDG